MPEDTEFKEIISVLTQDGRVGHNSIVAPFVQGENRRRAQNGHALGTVQSCGQDALVMLLF